MSKKDIQLLIGLAGILIAIGVFFFAYKPTMEKVDTMKAENVTLTARVAELQSLVEQKDYFLTQTEKYNNEVIKIYDEFPADYRMEDALSAGLNMEMTAPSLLLKAEFGARTEFYHPMAYNSTDVVLPEETPAATDPNAAPVVTPDAGATDAAAAADASTETAPAPAPEAAPASPIVASIQPVTFTTKSTYEGVKRQIDFLSDTENRQTINKLSVIYDQATGLLQSDIELNVYYITGTPKEYIAPILPSVSTGTDNIFSSIEDSGDAVELLQKYKEATAEQLKKAAENSNQDTEDTDDSEDDEEDEDSKENKDNKEKKDSKKKSN